MRRPIALAFLVVALLLPLAFALFASRARPTPYRWKKGFEPGSLVFGQAPSANFPGGTVRALNDTVDVRYPGGESYHIRIFDTEREARNAAERTFEEMAAKTLDDGKRAYPRAERRGFCAYDFTTHDGKGATLVVAEHATILAVAANDKPAGEMIQWVTGVEDHSHDDWLVDLWWNHRGRVQALFGLYVLMLAVVALLLLRGRGRPLVPDPGKEPVTPDELRRRLLTLRGEFGKLPYRVFALNARLIAEWLLVDEHWTAKMAAAGVTRLHRIQMTLDGPARTVRARQIAATIEWTENAGHVPCPTPTWSTSPEPPQNAERPGPKVREALHLQDGIPHIDPAGPWRFTPDELRAPLIETVLEAGWRWQG